MKKLLKIIAWIIGVLVGLLVLVQVILSPAVATRLVNKYAPKFIDADLSFEQVGINVFRDFPNVSVKIDSALLTYPHERFDSLEALSGARLMALGRGEEKDTLAFFSRFRASLNLVELIGGTIKVPNVELARPRIFAKKYNDTTANWNIFRPSDKQKDTTSGGMPTIKIEKVSLEDSPVIALCVPEDSIYTLLRMDDMRLRGKVNTSNIDKARGSFVVDSLAVAGTHKGDTVFFKLDYLTLKGSREKLALGAAAKANAATKAFGRLRVPLTLDALVSFPEDSVLTVDAEYLRLNAAGLPLEASGRFSKMSDRMFVDAVAAIKDFPLGKFFDEYAANFWDGAKDISTDAVISLDADAKGYLVKETGEIPNFTAALKVPRSKLRYAPLKETFNLDLDVSAKGDSTGYVTAKIGGLNVDADDILVYASGDARDLLGGDPRFKLDAGLIAEVASVLELLPSDLGIVADGEVIAELSGDVKASQLKLSKISNAPIKGYIYSDRIDFAMPADTLTAAAEEIEISVGAEGNKWDDSLKKGERVLTLSMTVDSLSAELKNMYARAGGLSLKAQNSADILNSKSKSKVHPFGGSLKAASLALHDADSSAVMIRNTSDNFRISAKDAERSIPVLRVNSTNERVFLRSGANRVMAKDFAIDATAVMNTLERRARMKALQDSLAAEYPDVPRDSLLVHARAQRLASSRSKELPEWLQEEDFQQNDIHVNLGETLSKYFREWDLSGSVNLGSARLVTPVFPLKNTIDALNCNFTNDKVELKKLAVHSGTSDISAKGSVWGLKKALMGRGVYNLDLRVSSDVLNANELLAALDAGKKNASTVAAASAADLDDDEYENAIVKTDLADAEVESKLLVIPANVNAKVLLEASEINYSTLAIDWAEADIVVKERCIQITNTCATSNMGDIYFEGFYSTKTKKNIKAGFYLNLVDITAEKVIQLMPAVDTIIPMLKSFSGMLDCTLAATTSLDDKMNILLPTMNGVMRITGKNLEINENEDIYKLAKTLMFRNKRKVHVDKMSVEGLVSDSKIEVFPFILDIDRYRLALSGIQNMDKSFKYHVSLIKSPLIFKIGIDLAGDFDDWKWRLGRAKYRNAKKVPVFTQVIDQTTISLSKSINNIFQKGVEIAVAENEAQKAINDYKDNTSYVAAIDIPLDTLSRKEARKMDAMEEASEILEGVDLDNLDALDSATVAKLDSLGIKIDEIVGVDDEDDEDDDEENDEE